MATPPKIPPVKVVPKKTTSLVKPAAPKTAPVARVKSAATAAAPVATNAPAPFVIDTDEALTAFVQQSESVLPPLDKRIAPVAATPEPAAAEPVVPQDVLPPVMTPASSPAPAVAETEQATTTPSQPDVVKNLTAAMETAAEWQAPNALEGHYIMNEAIETTKKFAEDAKSRMQGFATDFNEKAKAAVEKSSRTVEELSDITKGNLEALVESSKIAAKGVEALGQSAAEYGRNSFEKTSATLKSFASVKSPAEFFQLHSELMTSAFDTLASETAKNSEAVLKLAGEIVQPISNRYAVVSDKLKTLAA